MKNLEFDPDAFEDLAWWVDNDRKQALKTGQNPSHKEKLLQLNVGATRSNN